MYSEYFFLSFCFFSFYSTPGGDSTYERGGDARRKFWLKPLKETDLGVVQAFLTSKSNLRSGSIFVSLCNNIPAGKAKRKQAQF